MPGFRRRKEKSQTSALDASWILPSDEEKRSDAVTKTSNDTSDETYATSTVKITRSEQLIPIINSTDSSNFQEHQEVTTDVGNEASQGQAKVPHISHQHIATQYNPTRNRIKPRYAKEHSSMWLDESPESSFSAGNRQSNLSEDPTKEEEPQADTTQSVTAFHHGYPFSIFRIDKTPTASPGNAAPPVPPWRYLSSSYSPRNGSV
ncbi:hypothetical protein N7533_008787 [Penicillium manginii]|jgi:hypothetical protein|uniref:uncharacterized protein n=1 Tax=Penicillium manginii TaxID=203109 RepID=UPI00254952F1|nr:uncharacterized protein N7533_008787 [Penicillium manginii]KAJ5743917.1 hypothetical protein N7533_008787 [Penicillium manginii]